MIYDRASLLRNTQHIRNMASKLNKAVRRSLLVDSKRQAEKAAEVTGVFLEPKTVTTDLRGAYAVLNRWYRHAFARAPNPLRADMAKITGY